MCFRILWCGVNEGCYKAGYTHSGGGEHYTSLHLCLVEMLYDKKSEV